MKPSDLTKTLERSPGEIITEYLTGGVLPFSRVRAGQAEALAEAANITPKDSYLIKYPYLTQLLGGLATTSHLSPGPGFRLRQLAAQKYGNKASHLSTLMLALLGAAVPNYFRNRSIDQLINEASTKRRLQKIDPPAKRNILNYQTSRDLGWSDIYSKLNTGKGLV